YRELAPLSDLAWKAVEEEARRSIRHFIAGRHLFPLVGPHGYDAEAVPTGVVEGAGTIEGADVAIRRPQSYVELRAPFSVSRRAVEVLDRGGDIDLQAVVDAARRIAGAEDRLVFDGLPSAGIDGAVVVSLRGGDFEIHSGLDFSIRYLDHDRDEVRLELVETVTFRNLSPEAAIRIT
ncbi:MAG TPA: family 1 encapsulin nanocompartment shell protein, partial [Acidimicrobiales bacterium]